MGFPKIIAKLLPLFVLSACVFVVPDKKQQGSLDSTGVAMAKDSILKDSVAVKDSIPKDSASKQFFSGKRVDTRNVNPVQLVEFSKTLIGTPYQYASIDPKIGFDCSGFITYVFNHFNIIVPRSSIDFTNVGRTVPADSARMGDLILFTGTDSTEKFVGHMGLVISNEGQPLEFIHSTSGKKHGVTITPLSDYYRSRYMKTIRIFP